MEEIRVVLITAPANEDAERIARLLVEERLAACVNIVPKVLSVYRWEGAVQSDAESLLIVKTRADRLSELEARVRSIHPYSVPEIVALRVTGGNPAYIDWVFTESSPRTGTR